MKKTKVKLSDLASFDYVDSLINPPLEVEGTKVSVTRGGKTIPLTEGVDYDINAQEITFREGVLFPLPDAMVTTEYISFDEIKAKYPLTPDEMLKLTNKQA
jgi:hypothetical protein